ncbi:alpha/beta hydrolase family protein [Pontibacter ruber]|uniref:Alpha/beta hydrolase family protein n=1 Tax=Pontibacter ruber TaxID=1343895 RepID=A0ABW5CYA8_9BACT|nr:hypothetical protein [Pontibacter ruber]
MRTLLILLVSAILYSCSSNLKSAVSSVAAPPQELTTDTLMKFSAQPAAGFNFEYLVYLPKGLQSQTATYLMVETNNSGLNDSIEFHERGARRAASKSGVANYVSKKLQLPLLIPIFPRSETNWLYYTHALDRDVLLTKADGLERLDLQLLAMIDDARKQLAVRGYPLKEKLFITGFSASGTFANRFSILHPEKVKATASGGINGIPILPVAAIDGQTLNYPLGIADLEQITGKPVNLTEFSKLPKMLYMGALDDNDAVAFDDGYTKEEREIVYRLMGKQLVPQRWQFVEQVYIKNNIEADFRTYPNIGHGTDLQINNDLVEFFRKHME